MFYKLHYVQKQYVVDYIFIFYKLHLIPQVVN